MALESGGGQTDCVYPQKHFADPGSAKHAAEPSAQKHFADPGSAKHAAEPSAQKQRVASSASDPAPDATTCQIASRELKGSLETCVLLELDGCADAFQRLLGGLRLLPVYALQHRLGRVVDQLLGLLQAQARQRTHLLDDLDLLFACRGQHHVE